MESKLLQDLGGSGYFDQILVGLMGKVMLVALACVIRIRVEGLVRPVNDRFEFGVVGLN